MQVDIVSDVICPWCYIGKRRFERALDGLGERHRVAVTWRPFQLNPDMPADGMARAAYLEAKFGGGERAREIYARIEEAGAGEGIAFDFARIKRTPNTVQAHRLIRLGQKLDKQDAVVEALFLGYFTEGANIGDDATLVALAERAGVGLRDAERYLAGDEDRELVLGEDDAARRMGIHGVPCFVFERQYAISGAQDPAVLVDAVERVAELSTPQAASA
ncbi:MAG: DsbA family oxidoreductase [Proteobacteria bacterium]|nr:DsbA family oxidoreductase [Pseudomonadota bacterium]